MIIKASETTCPKHDEPLKVYCESCHEAICVCCTISKEHNTHHFELISECYPKHYQQVMDELDLLEKRIAEVNTAVAVLANREMEVVMQGEEVKKQVRMHAQQLIDEIQRSEEELLQELDTVIKEKRHLLKKQREQAERVQYQLHSCEVLVTSSLQEWNEQQVLMNKERILVQLKIVSQHVQPSVFQPLEEADMKYTKSETIENGIGEITSNRYGKAILKSSPCLPNTASSATLKIMSHDSSQFPVSPSLIFCRLFSPGDNQPTKCDVKQKSKGKFNICFTPQMRGRHQLIVQVGGIEISSIFPVISPSMMKGKPVGTISGLSMPSDVAVYDHGEIVVAEWSAHCLTILNKKGKKLQSFGSMGAREGWFTCPHGVAISDDGCILVTDDHRLQKITLDGVFVSTVGSNESGIGQLEFDNPTNIAVHPNTGQIFVTDRGNDRIQVFHSNLTFSHTIVLQSIPRFNGLYDVSLDSEGCLYVVTSGNHYITKFSATGQIIETIGFEGSAPGQLRDPNSICISNGLVYVSEEGNHRVSIFDTNGTFLHHFGNLFNPHDIIADKWGNVYVTCANSIVLFY